MQNFIGTTFQLTNETIAAIAELAAQDGSNIEDKQREVISAGVEAVKLGLNNEGGVQAVTQEIESLRATVEKQNNDAAALIGQIAALKEKVAALQLAAAPAAPAAAV